MMDFTKYVSDKNDVQFLKDIQVAVGLDSQSEVFLKYKDFSFMLEPHGEVIEVYSNFKKIGVYDTIQDFFLNFKLDEKSFIEQIDEIDYE